MLHWSMFLVSLFFVVFMMRNEDVPNILLMSLVVVLFHIFGVLLSILGKMEKK